MIFVTPGGQYDHDNQRPAFLAHVLQEFNNPPAHQAICHAVSYYNIEAWLFEMLAAGNATGPMLTTLCQCVCNNDIVPPVYNACITNIVNANPQVPSQNVVDQCNVLLSNLNSCLDNLRLGDAGWNQSVGSCYDPAQWVHFNAAGNIDFNHLGNPAQNVQIPFPQPPFATANKFFLVDIDDCNQLARIAPIQAATPVVFAKGNGVTAHGVPVSFICSSCNQFFLPQQAMPHQPDPVYFYNTQTQQWTQ